MRNRYDRDRDGDGVRNRRDADANGNGRVDARYDRNRDGQIDRRFDRNNNGRIDPRYGNGYGRPGYGNGYNGGNNWNRGWRNDNRYDWQRYRSANRYLYSLPRYYAPYGWNYGYRRFDIGITLNSLLFSRNYWIDDPYQYRLPPAYPPYRWVRYYNDALLIDERSGYVVDAQYDFFY
ncbi:RcnB family protein [Sphingomonas antarctica]|uniref:RcnB family protein n=1 Tax=Sphingomonas antarctica TaxID=2040274 RepID=UPI0039ED859B